MPNENLMLDPKERQAYGRTITAESNAMNFYGQLKGSDKNAVIMTDLQVENQPTGAAVRIYFDDKFINLF